jgi:hypothetical protein
MRVAPLCNSLRNDVASMETYSSRVNCPKEKMCFCRSNPCSFCDSKINIIVLINGCFHNGPVICPRLVIMAHEYSEPTTIRTCKTQFSNKHSEPTTICSCKTDNNALLKLMVKMNTRNLQLYVLEKQPIF